MEIVSWVTAQPHSLCEQMVVDIIRIVPTGIVLCNNGICCQVKEKTSIFTNQLTDDLIQMILCNDLTNHNECSDAEVGTPVSCFADLWEFRLQEEFQEVGVWIHRLWRSIQALIDRCILWYGIMLIRTVFAVASVINIGCSTESFSVWFHAWKH